MLSVMHNHDFGLTKQLAAYLGLVSVERCVCPSALTAYRLHHGVRRGYFPTSPVRAPE